MKKMWRLTYEVIVTGIFIIVMPSCAHTSSPVGQVTTADICQDFKQCTVYPKEEALFFLRCEWRGIEHCLSNADFCVIADREILKQEPVAPKPKVDTASVESSLSGIKTHKCGYDLWEKRKVDERIKIHSVIFGDIQEKEILISRVVDPPDFDKPYYDNSFFSYWRSSRVPIAIPLVPPVDNKNQKLILFGNKKENDYQIIFSLWEGQEIISLQAITSIKNSWFKESRYMRDAFLVEKQDLLTNSNDSDLLSYFFRRCQSLGNISEMIELIKCLSDDNPIMANRKFLSYGFSLYVLYELNHQMDMPENFGISTVGAGSKVVMGRWILNDSQKQILIDIASKKLSEVTTITEGLKYLRLIGMFTYDPSDHRPTDAVWADEKWQEFNSPTPIDSLLFKKVPTLKDNLKKAAQSLSKRFENDKDYPEWQKWVNKIFPEDQTPKTIEKAK
ncbi:MAG: hypothetical protein HZA49_06965 [Planctomycetes bacterium]|nr:hypothetical protein [Planctomycetota bacterium]